EVVATSFGPDETLGTADDITVRANMEWIFGGGRFWGGEDDADGHAAAGGPAARDEAGAAPPADPSAEGAGDGGGTTVRSDFRETVYVNPNLITDESGRDVARQRRRFDAGRSPRRRPASVPDVPVLLRRLQHAASHDSRRHHRGPSGHLQLPR
ncbi:MAG: hypothetical protein JRH11_14120, partial [Deltaproteobacteria bacterium]|nr:hypothetical protein [Deltaproteobacteria bacterium]